MRRCYVLGVMVSGTSKLGTKSDLILEALRRGWLYSPDDD